MRNLNTRRWSTPLTMGTGLFVVITGLLMFFVAERPFKFAHELVGIGFSAAVALHVLSHWRSLPTTSPSAAPSASSRSRGRWASASSRRRCSWARQTPRS